MIIQIMYCKITVGYMFILSRYFKFFRIEMYGEVERQPSQTNGFTQIRSFSPSVSNHPGFSRGSFETV